MTYLRSYNLFPDQDEAPAEDEALDDGADEYDYGSDEDFPGATG